MSSWRYCDSCNAGQPVPKTPQEDTECHCCGVTMEPTMTELSWITEILERLEALEKLAQMPVRRK